MKSYFRERCLHDSNIWSAFSEKRALDEKSPVIHVVDDDPSFRGGISRLLRVSGYEVADYESATSFLRASESARPGCILLDVQMPTLGASSFRNSWPNCL